MPAARVSQPRVSQPHGRQHKGWGAFLRGPLTGQSTSPTTTQRREPALNTHTTHPSGCPSTAYTLAVYHEVIRIVGAARNGRDVLDIANNVALSVLVSTESIMARYPKPEEFARACAHNAGHSFDRTERVQRCEGARLRTHADGTLGKQRTWESGNATFGADQQETWTHLGDPASSFEFDSAHRLDAASEFGAYTQGIDQRDLRELMLVDGHEWQVAEVAREFGQSRETVSRRVNRTRERIRANRAAAFRSARHLAA